MTIEQAMAAEAELTEDADSAPEPASTRRRWLQGAMASVFWAGVGTASYARWFEPHWVEIVRRDLPIPGLPESLQGRTLLQLSDIHVGHVVDSAYLLGAFEQAQALQPDIVVITGDFLSWDSAFDWPAFERVYAKVPHGRLATLGCLGNHDYGRNWSDPRLSEEVTSRLNAAGLEILRGDARDIEGLKIGGVEDLWGSRWNRGSAEQVIRERNPDIILCHNPDACDIAMWSRYRGWILSGHTHGGQCRLPWGSPPILPVMNERYTAGEFDLGDGRRLYINRGLGYLRKVRFCVRPEITLFTLTRESNNSPGSAA